MPPIWLRCAAIGAATGARASAAITSLTWTAHHNDPAWLRHPATKVISSLAAAGESVGDQLPSTPSRLAPAGIGPRLVLSAGAGAVLARRHGWSPFVGAATALAGSLAGAVGGSRLRAIAASRVGSDHPGAVLEDAVVVGLAGFATR